MRLKFICCDVFFRIACDIVSKSPHIVDIEFVPMLAHNMPNELRKDLQERIDRSGKVRQYDKIILGYGLCGNAAIGLTCPVPMIIPRIHDCCTMFMGSKDKYIEGFGDALSMRWSTCGYYERCHMEEIGHYERLDAADGNAPTRQHAAYLTSAEYIDLVEKYGEENAEYVWETLHPEIETDEAAYIEIDGFEYSGSYEGFKKDIESKNKKLRHLKGDLSFLQSLINGPWDEKRFLEIMPGQKIIGVYDMDTVMSTE